MRVAFAAVGAQCIAWILYAGLVLVIVLSGGWRGFDVVAILALLVLPTVLVMWSFFFRIVLDRTEVRIVSWLRVYRVPVREVEEILVAPYSGILTRGSSHNFFSRRFPMIGFTMRSGRERFFPVTIASRARAWKVARGLADSIGVDVVESDWT